MQSLIGKDAFIGLDRCTWLYSGAETPACKVGLDAMIAYMHNRSLGPEGRARHSETEKRLREHVAALVNGTPEQIALLSNSSDVIVRVLDALALRPGDNVVIHDLEFPSGVLPALSLKERGIEVRIVPHRGWRVTADDLLERVDAATKLVLTSHVSYVNGSRLDYQSLYGRLKQTGTLLFLDATQSLGALAVDLRHTDFLVCSSYKWLLSVHGLGILGINPARTSGLIPSTAGWRSVQNLFSPDRFETVSFREDASKFELGYPSYPSIYAMEASARLILETGVAKIEKHILQLSGQAIEGFRSLGYEVMTPEAERERSGNVSAVCPEGERVAAELQKRNVYVWGGDGRIRASVHAFNDSSDIGTLMSRLRECASP